MQTSVDKNQSKGGVQKEDWKWQIQNALKSQFDFEKYFILTQNEKEAFKKGKSLFNIQATPYYISLVDVENTNDPIRKMILPQVEELQTQSGIQNDPLGENKNRPCERIIHRYQDRVLFLVTDFCGIYCRYCTRKHFTGGGQVFPKKDEYQEAINYIKKNKGVKEVILSGGDPLTLSNSKLEKILKDLNQIEHLDLIRIGSRMPAACPMRLDKGLLNLLKAQPKTVVLMSHFNHHQELSEYTKRKLEEFTSNGIPIFNQMVLLNGINNSAALIYKLSRELIKCKVFPYYMFQCDPSPGTAHLQTTIQESLEIQKELWGRCSGLALPTYSVDIPSGGGKAYLTPDFIQSESSTQVSFKGYDGVESTYTMRESPKAKPFVSFEVRKEWDEVCASKVGFLDQKTN